jgi:CheY-like chemotaxis protein
MRNGAVDSGEAALRTLRSAVADGEAYHTVLLDYLLPGTDGTALASQIKAEPGLGDTIAILLRPASCEGKLHAAEHSGIDEILAKPPRASQLLDAFATTWGRKTRLPVCQVASGNGPPRSIPNLFLEGETIRVLLAEDNIVNQKVAVSLLGRLGIRTDVAANGLEAVQMSGLLPYDVIFMDCQMPEMDGYAAARQVRLLQGAGQRVTIIAMTAEVLAGTRERCLAAGMDDYMTKPVSLHSMVEILQKWRPQSSTNAC